MMAGQTDGQHPANSPYRILYTYKTGSEVHSPQSRNTVTIDPTAEMSIQVVERNLSDRAPMIVKPAVAAKLNSIIVNVARKGDAPNRSRANSGRKIFGR
jgi:hypothetical protein